MSRLWEALIQRSIEQGVDYRDAISEALEYSANLAWEQTEDGDGWVLNKPTIVNHNAPVPDEHEPDRMWRGGPGKIDGLIFKPEYRQNRFFVGDESFGREDINPLWKEGFSLEFYRPDIGWVELEKVYFLPPDFQEDSENLLGS